MKTTPEIREKWRKKAEEHLKTLHNGEDASCIILALLDDVNDLILRIDILTNTEIKVVESPYLNGPAGLG